MSLNRSQKSVTSMFVLLLTLVISLLTQPAFAGDNNVLWDWLYHAKTDPTQETVPGLTAKFRTMTGCTVDIYALADAGDLTAAKIRYWANSEQIVTMSKVGTGSYSNHNMDIWKGTIKAPADGGPATNTQVWYRILVEDGTKSANLRASNGSYVNPLGQHVRSDAVAQQDYNYTVPATCATVATDSTVKIANASAETGQTGKIAVTFTAGENITGGSISIPYNPSEILLLGGTAGTVGTLTLPLTAMTQGQTVSFDVPYVVDRNRVAGTVTLTPSGTLTGGTKSVVPTSGIVTITLAPTGGTTTPTPVPNNNYNPNDPSGWYNRTAFVHLFEWKWADIAKECENWLGPKGFAAIQVSPPQGHVTAITSSAGNFNPWWIRYQPTSYILTSRSGTEAEFADMVTRCKAAGVAIYVDAVINHMSGKGGKTTTGTTVTEYNYPEVPFGTNDFHYCGRNGGNIGNYNDVWEVQNCALVDLDDLKTESTYVQDKIVAYLNKLISLGVAGIRIDAAKHMPAADIQAIKNKLTTQNFFIFSEVIDQGGEPIKATDYTGIGSVTEFKYSLQIGSNFSSSNLAGMKDVGNGKLSSDKAVVFIDNHDNQRGHGGGGNVMNFHWGNTYTLGNVLMLAHPYGYPSIMSSYYFKDDGTDYNKDQGPPSDANGNTTNVYTGNGVEDVQCVHRGVSQKWICEQRWLPIANMVGFRNGTNGQPMANWYSPSQDRVAFGRGNKGFVAINYNSSAWTYTFPTGMPAGDYCNVIVGNNTSTGCTRIETTGNAAVEGATKITVDASGNASITVPPYRAVAFYAGAPTSGSTGGGGTTTPVRPTLSVTAPANNGTVSGATAIKVNATHADGITKVEFYDGANTLIATDTTAPYETTVDFTGKANSTKWPIVAKAYSSKGTDAATYVVLNVGTSVTVTPVTPPVVSITSPADGSAQTGSFTATANASHAGGIKQVEFFLNGTSVGVDTTAPYSMVINPTTDGSNVIKAIATASTPADGSNTATNSITVVKQPVGVPSVSITNPANNSTQTGSFTASATATHSSGIKQVEFFLDGFSIGVVTAAPYSVFVNPTDGTHTLSAVATANTPADGSNKGSTQVTFTKQTGGASIVASTASLAVGATGNVVLNVTGSPAVNRITLEIDYDATVADVVSCTTASGWLGICNIDFEHNKAGTDTIRMSMVAANSKSGIFDLATIAFKTVGAAGTTSPVKVRIVEYKNEANLVGYSVTDGKISVAGGTVVAGDFSCDGTAGDTLDLLGMLMYILEMPLGNRTCHTTTADIVKACDVNNNASCELIDVLTVLECVVGRTNTFCPTATGRSADEVVAVSATPIAVSVGTPVLNEDGTVSVPVDVDVPTDGTFSASIMDVNYDSTVLELVDCDTGLDFGTCNTTQPGMVTFAVLSGSPTSADFIATTLKFKLLGGITVANSTLSINVQEMYASSGVPVDSTTRSLEICGVVTCVPTSITLSQKQAARNANILLLITSLGVLLTATTMALKLSRRN